MEIVALDNRERVRGAIRAHGVAWQEAYAGLVPDDVLDSVTTEPTDDDIDQWLDRLPDEQADGAVAYGVVADGAVRGYVFVRWTETKSFVRPDEAGLKEIYVHPDWWGEGLGTALLDAAVSELPDYVTGIALEVFAENDLGRHFYESRGFEADDGDRREIAGESYEIAIYRRQW